MASSGQKRKQTSYTLSFKLKVLQEVDKKTRTKGEITSQSPALSSLLLKPLNKLVSVSESNKSMIYASVSLAFILTIPSIVCSSISDQWRASTQFTDIELPVSQCFIVSATFLEF